MDAKIKSRKFDVGQVFKCFEGSNLYQVKCMDTKEERGSRKYYVHYYGWKKRYDEWVSESRCVALSGADETNDILDEKIPKRNKKTHDQPEVSKKVKKRGCDERGESAETGTVMKANINLNNSNEKDKLKAPANTLKDGKVAKKVKLKHTIVATAGAKSAKTFVADSKSTKFTTSANDKETIKTTAGAKSSKAFVADSKSKTLTASANDKENHESSHHSVESPSLKKLRRICIPPKLEKLLVDDHVYINEQEKLVDVPQKHTVATLLKSYTKANTAKYGAEIKRARIELNSLRELFNLTLSNRLLYKFERTQLGDLIEKYPNVPSCDLYGVPHLIRFLSTMEVSMKKHGIGEEDVSRIRFHVQELLDYIDANLENLFTAQSYFNAPLDYQRRAMSDST